MNKTPVKIYAPDPVEVRRCRSCNGRPPLRFQHHDQIVTGQDIGLSVRCSYDLQNRSVGQGIELAMAPATGPGGDSDASADDPDATAADKGVVNGLGGGNGVEETAFVISPTVMMRITNRAGGDIHAAQVGDPLSLRFHILDDRSPYEIFVRELIALDGVDASEILLIDGDGCPTDPAIMGPITAVASGTGTVKVLEAPFDAFKFPTSDIVQFKALVTPCLPKCEPINCNVVGHNGAVRRADSFGRYVPQTFFSFCYPGERPLLPLNSDECATKVFLKLQFLMPPNPPPTPLSFDQRVGD